MISSIRSKLLIGFSVVLLFMLFLSVFLLKKLSASNERVNDLLSLSVKRIQLSEEMLSEILSMGQHEKSMILEKDISRKDYFKDRIYEAVARVEKKINESKDIADNKIGKMTVQFAVSWEKFRIAMDEIVAVTLKNENEKAIELSLQKGLILYNEVISTLNDLIRKNQLILTEEQQKNNAVYNADVRNIGMFLILSILVSMALCYWIIRVINARIGFLTLEAERTASREHSGVNREDKTKDELSSIYSHLMNINRSFKEITENANAMASGNYAVEIIPRSENDTLGKALNKMALSLKTSAKENERHVWISTGLNRLNDTLRGDLKTEELAESTIAFMCEYLNADIGALYLLDEDGKRLSRTATYAFSTEDRKMVFELDEGLIGEAARKQKAITLDTIHQEPIQIVSATQKIRPKGIYIAPFSFEGKNIGVMELGKITSFTETEKEFIHHSQESIGISFSNAIIRKKIRNLLSEANERNQMLANKQFEIEQQLEGLNDVALVSITDVEGNITYVNERFEKVSKYTKAELIGRNHRILKSGKQPDGLFTGMWKSISLGKIWNGEIINIAKDQTYYWVDTTIIPILNVHGEIEKFLSVRFEITELKKQQEELHKQTQILNEKNQLLANKQLEVEQQLEGLNDVALVSITDIDGNITYVNERFERVSKYTKAELIGRNHRILKSGKQPDGLFTGMWKAISGGKVWNGEIVNKAKDGTYYWVDTTIIPISNIQGKIEKYLSVRFEITELKNQQAALKDLNEELQLQQEELKQANEELEEQTRNLKEQQQELQIANEELEEQTQALEAKNKEVEVARLQVEQKTKQLEITGKYKSEFLANMSHELRTPLNSLLILSKDLSENKPNNLLTDQIESAQIIYKSGTDLLTLINEVLDLSKIEAGKMTLYPERVMLRDFVAELERTFKFQAGKKELKFSVSLASQLPEYIITDNLRLNQIVKNLLSNAIKFTEKGGISININKHSEESVAIAIGDTGIGIPEEKQQFIFEAFHQADGGTARKYGGTGLGLSISRDLAKLLGGRIDMISKVNSGSVFTLILPVEIQQHVPEQLSDSPIKEDESLKKPDMSLPTYLNYPTIQDDRQEIENQDRTVLIIEDDLRFAEILKSQASRKGFKCLAAATGEDGLVLARQFMPGAIILDMELPGISGQQVLHQLKTNAATRHIPVHIISATERSLEPIKDGAVEYLTKPLNKTQLESAFNRIESMVDRKMKNLLIVEDNDNLRMTIRKLIGNGDVKCFEATTGAEAIQLCCEQHIDCIVLDIGLPDMSGFELIQQLNKENRNGIPPIVVYTGRELTREENYELRKYAKTIIIKGVRSEERLLDETALFLHRTISNLPKSKQKIIHNLYDKDIVFQDKKILLTDDDMRNVFALSKILSERGMKVIKAENGLMALQAIEQHPDISLVLMDIMMPEMDGYEAMSRIRKDPKYDHLPLIALTAKAMKEDKQKCMDAGANDYITKPIDTERLLSLMRVWLSK